SNRSTLGVDILSRRPLTCTVGVLFWATDDGEWDATHTGTDGRLYKCTSTNVWTLSYTPYPYPHPMTVASSVSSPSTTITITNVTGSGLTLSWTKGTSATPSLLQYEVVESSSGNISTLSDAETNGTVIQPYTADINTINVTGLRPLTTYFF